MQNHQNQNNAQNLSAETRSKGGQHSPGNFKNDRERASEAGKKGGHHTPAAKREDNDED